MTQNGRPKIEIDRAKETRTQEISKMIDEGGLGTRATHYQIVKRNSSKEGEQMERSLTTVVNELVANQGVLFIKLHQYHWYVTGRDFYTLHEKFEQLYNETAQQLDAFAERLIVRGEKPYSTLSEFLEHATIEENRYTDKISSEQMVKNIITDFNIIKQTALEGVQLASEENDSVTEDMLIGYIEQIELNVWMLRSFIEA